MIDTMNNYVAFQLLLCEFTVASYSKSDFNIVLALIECLSRDGSIPKIKDLADQAATSVSTISRFAKKLGFEDYQSFRYKLSNIREVVDLKRRVKYKDDPETVKRKILANLNETWDHIDYAKLEQIADILLNSKNNMFAGLSNSLICFFVVYKDLFFKNGANYFFFDLKTQEEFLSRLGKDDCLLLVSTNTEASMLTKPQLLKNLKKKGVTIILFSQDVPEECSELCDIVYQYGRNEDLSIGDFSLQYLGYVISDIIRTKFPN